MSAGTALVPAQEDVQEDVLDAVRSLGGTGTVGDVVASSGRPRDEVESALRSLLETRRGHLDVSDSGELVYRFDPKLIRRDAEPLTTRFRRSVSRFLKGAFKAWIVSMLVVYFAVFVALVVAALVAMASRGDNRRGGWGRPGRGPPIGRFPIGDFWLWYYIWTPRWRLGRPYYGRRWERTLPKEERVPFYKKVFAFVFGPDRPEPTRKQLDRSTLRLIRARSGVVSPAELVQHTALPLHEAEEEMGRLTGAYAGEPHVTPDGELVYAFPELMVSAHGSVRATEPKPAWLRMEHPLELTGNEKKTDALIAGMGGFNLLAGATAPWFIFPQLGIGGLPAFVGLVVIPVIFSLVFLGIPMARRLGVRRENRKRQKRNARRAILGLVYEEALTDGDSVTVDQALAHATAKLGADSVRREDVEEAMHALSAEFDADVIAREDGAIGYRFPAIRKQFLASEASRRTLRLDSQRLGPTVYSTEDTTSEANARDLESFDRELAGATPDLAGYLPSPGRIDFEDDYELVAFDEELERLRASG